MKTSLTFANLSLFNAIKNNRSINRMGQINRAVNWSKIESRLLSHYPFVKSFDGNDAYPVFLDRRAICHLSFKEGVNVVQTV